MALSNIGLGINLNVGGNADSMFGKLGQKFGDFAKMLPGGLGGLGKMALGLGAAGVAAAAAAKALAILKETVTEAIQVHADFEYGMAEVHTLLKAETEQYFPALTETVKTSSVRFGQDLGVMTKAMYQAVSAGQNVATIGEFFDVAGKLAVGGVTDMQTSVDGLTSVVNAYGLNMDQTRVAADQMFIAMREGKTTIGELSANMGEVAPIAANVGIGLDQVLASVSALTLTGLKTGQAITGIKQTMLELLRVTPRMATAAKKYGVDTRQSTIQQMGFVNWLKMARTAIEGHGGKLTEMFESAETLNAVLSLTGKQFETNTRTLAMMTAETGTADAAFGKIAATGKFLAMQAAQARVDMLEEIGATTAPLVDVWNRMRLGFFTVLKSIIVWWKDNFLARYVAIFKPFVTIIVGYLQLLRWMWTKYFQGLAWVAVKVFNLMSWPMKKVSEGVQIIIEWAKVAWEWMGKFATGLVQKWAHPIAWLVRWLRIIGEEIQYRWEQAKEFAATGGLSLATAEGRRMHAEGQAKVTKEHERRRAGIDAEAKAMEERFAKGQLEALRQHAREEAAKGPQETKVVNTVKTEDVKSTGDYMKDIFFRDFAYGELSR